MSERKACVQCGRQIDAYARICPYCNWNQEEPLPAARRASSDQPAYVPPADRRWQKPVFGTAGGAVLLVAAFTIGAHIHGSGPPKEANREATAAAPAVSQQSPRANVMLIPDNGPVPAPDQPITSAPSTTTAVGLAAETNRTDATAASSAEYAQMAQRARAEQHVAPVDPRSVVTSVYGNRPAARASNDQLPPMTSASAESVAPAELVRTPPVPEYQPLPDLTVSEDMTARVQLLVGADGRVHDVNVLDSMPGGNDRLIAAVQSWRFKPATANGAPVASSFSAAISFHANE